MTHRTSGWRRARAVGRVRGRQSQSALERRRRRARVACPQRWFPSGKKYLGALHRSRVSRPPCSFGDAFWNPAENLVESWWRSSLARSYSQTRLQPLWRTPNENHKSRPVAEGEREREREAPRVDRGRLRRARVASIVARERPPSSRRRRRRRSPRPSRASHRGRRPKSRRTRPHRAPPPAPPLQTTGSIRDSYPEGSRFQYSLELDGGSVF